MNLVKNLSTSFKKLRNLKTMEIVFVCLLVLYLISNVSTPYELAPYVNNVYMYLSMIALVVLLFLYSNPLIALFFGIVAIVFLNRSKKVDHHVMKPSTANRDNNIEKLNSKIREKTLEEELVGDIVKRPMNIAGPSDYHPVLCESHGASKL